MRNLEDKKNHKKTAPKTYKNNKNKKNKNHEISSSRFLFSHTPLKKKNTNRVCLDIIEKPFIKKNDPLPVLLIFILEKKPHTF